MQRYKDLSGNSGVTSYEISEQSIVIQFGNGWTYRYTDQSAGHSTIATMKRLAQEGQGLSSFISRHAHESFEEKWQ